MTTCTVCELHAESVFRIEGMDCHEEVTHPRAAPEAAGRPRGARRRRRRPAAQREVRRREADHQPHRGSGGADRHARVARARGAARRRRARMRWRDRLVAASAVSLAAGLRAAAAAVGPALVRGGVRRWRSCAGGAHTARRAWRRCAVAHPRHLRPDAGRGRRRGRARRVVRGAHRSCSCSRWRSCSSRARWSARAGAIRALMDLAPPTRWSAATARERARPGRRRRGSATS